MHGLHYFATLIASLAVLVNAVPSPLVARDGPSGYLITPTGPDTEETYYGSGPGPVLIQYQGVATDYLSYPANERALTISIDLTFTDPSGASPPFPVAYGLRASNTTSNLFSATFTGPACGKTWQLVVVEHQAYQGQDITFQSAAPYVPFVCTPEQ